MRASNASGIPISDLCIRFCPTRVLHEVRQTTTSQLRNAYLSSLISDLITYGSFYMTQDEADKRLRALLDKYYAFLAVGVVNFRNGIGGVIIEEGLGNLGIRLNLRD